ncbi:MAG: hypothetical protein NZ583_03595 [Desulfobacterota bacterium]|nr:hypothetical protein [Thermodesulfobacteriota bacterium]MDW8001971.1 hypothetical protein [Deltaproteobacteria bacterium]
MRRFGFCVFLILFIFSSCSKKIYRTEWPKDASTIIAYCELSVATSSFSFEGFISFNLNYPDFRAEILGPFGTTLLTLKGSRSYVTFGEENEEFRDLLYFPIGEIIEDIWFAGEYLRQKEILTLDKGSYRVTYDWSKKEPKICWQNQSGYLCLNFLEIKKSQKT